MRVIISILFFSVILSCPMVARAGTQEPSAEKIQVIIDGKSYASMHDYKREQVRQRLSRALSSDDLDEFSDKDLLAIIEEVRKEQKSGYSDEKSKNSVPKEPVETPAQEHDQDQMEDMLKQYLDEHEHAVPIKIDPQKVKNILIGPGPSPETSQ